MHTSVSEMWLVEDCFSGQVRSWLRADMGGAGRNPAKPTRTTRPDYPTRSCAPDPKATFSFDGQVRPLTVNFGQNRDRVEDARPWCPAPGVKVLIVPSDSPREADNKMRRWRSWSSLFGALVMLAGLASPAQLLAQAPATDLRIQLRELAAAHGFILKGLETLGDDAATPVGGDLRHQIERLLEKYNFVLLHDADGGIAEVRISYPKQAAPILPDTYAIQTTRMGQHYLVEAVLIGLESARMRTSLIVDTGATTVVLPASMIAPLGFRPDDLRDGWSQTANGRIAIKQGTLASLWIDDVVAHDVAVAFVVDPRLPDTRLLGMSFLGRFRVTLDEADDLLILTTIR